MFNLLSSKVAPIGLDIGHSCIKMIQLANEGGRISVIAAAKVPIELDGEADDEQRRECTISAIKEIRNSCGIIFN